MTNDQKLDMFKMRLEKVSYQAIGEKYGISKQAAQQMLNAVLHSGTEESRKNSCIYPNISKWCTDAGYSLRKLAKMAQISEQPFYNKLSGKGNFNQSMIEKILSVTGMAYEKAFYREVKK